MNRLQTTATLITLIAIVFVVLSPGPEDPVVIVKGHHAHFSSRTPSAIIALLLVASQHARLQLIAIIAHRYRFASPHNQDLITFTCARLC
jgi:hypothetical protein